MLSGRIAPSTSGSRLEEHVEDDQEEHADGGEVPEPAGRRVDAGEHLGLGAALLGELLRVRVVRAGSAAGEAHQHPEQDPGDHPAVPELKVVAVDRQHDADQDQQAHADADERAADPGDAERQPHLVQRGRVPVGHDEDAEEHECRGDGEGRQDVQREHPLVEAHRVETNETVAARAAIGRWTRQQGTSES